jgi:hypothetical protein
MGNIPLQAPFQDFQPYTPGVGFQRIVKRTQNERRQQCRRWRKIASCRTGSTAVDYRVRTSGALNSPAHRIYAGLNLKF